MAYSVCGQPDEVYPEQQQVLQQQLLLPHSSAVEHSRRCADVISLCSCTLMTSCLQLQAAMICMSTVRAAQLPSSSSKRTAVAA
jgi:hypothetical protein